jgi:hypothetical protein
MIVEVISCIYIISNDTFILIIWLNISCPISEVIGIRTVPLAEGLVARIWLRENIGHKIVDWCFLSLKVKK